MKNRNILREYCYKVIYEKPIIPIFVVLSVVLSISISLSIPQISTTIDEYWDKNSYQQNGGNLKVEVGYFSEKFEKKLSEMKKEDKIQEVYTQGGTIKVGKKQIYSEMLYGKYHLKSNEVILSRSLSKVIGLTIGDNITINGKKYKIKSIEDFPKGVSKQASEIGYVKLNKNRSKNFSSKLVFIKSKNYKKIKKELEKIEGGYDYTTIDEVTKSLKEKNSSNMMSLNMLNTMSIVMTIISILTCIILIISRSKKDISILLLQSIPRKKIKHSFENQFRLLMFPAILMGSAISICVAKILLKMNHFDFSITLYTVQKLVVGIILFSIFFNFCITISCNWITYINPLNVLKGNKESIKKFPFFIKIFFLTIFFLTVYAKYVGNRKVMTGSILILIFLFLFLVLIYSFINLVLLFRSNNKLYRYTVCSIKEKKQSFLLLILSLSFTILFFLIGFTFSDFISKEYTRSLEQKLNYNYMLYSKKESTVEKLIKQTRKSGFFTKIKMKNGFMIIDENEQKNIILCGIDKNKYGVKYKIIEGTGVFEGNSKEVVISDTLSEKYKLKVGNSISLQFEQTKSNYKIKGIYDSGNMNTEHILIDNHNFFDKYNSTMYIANIVDENIVEALDDVMMINLTDIGSSLKEGLQSVLSIFKGICCICIVLSFIFNFNLIYIDMIGQEKNYTILQALGLSKNELLKKLLFEELIAFLLTMLVSMGTYFVLMIGVIKFAFKSDLTLSIEMLFVPCSIAILSICILYSIPIFHIKQMRGYERLRELV